ncbi:MAG: hypothetical protein ACTSWE_01720 [Promethearchaeota archaeon]
MNAHELEIYLKGALFKFLICKQKILGGHYLSGNWEENYIILDTHVIKLNPKILSGMYDLQINLVYQVKSEH